MSRVQPLFRYLLHTLLLGLLVAACAQDEEPLPEWDGKGDLIGDVDTGNPKDRWRGQSQFVSASPYWDYLPLRTLETNAEKSGTGADAQRTVEEADVYRHDPARKLVYALNAYRGLQVIDVTDVDAPRLLGRADLAGTPQEMYVRGTTAYVILTSAEWTGESGPHQGSLLRVYDLANPASPLVVGELELFGYVSGSRLLATDDGSSAVIYVVSNVYDYLVVEGNPEWNEQTYVMSIDVTDGRAPREVQKVKFDGAGWNSHVTPQAMFVAQHDWMARKTVVRYVDISDLGGAIRVRGAAEVEGQLSWGDKGDLQLDHHEGVLRVASQIWGWGGTGETRVRVATFSTANPDAIAPLGQLDVAQGENLVATRFAGERAYLFHMVQVDPLEVIDLSDPAAPRSMGLLRIEGSVDHIEVRGDRLLALGNDGATSRKLAVILFDVADPSAPVELARATAGEGWAWTSASFDIKTFRVVDDLGLVLLPVASSSWDSGTGYQFRQWLQLFSFDLAAGTVARRGEIQDGSGVHRSFPVGSRIVTLSDRRMQVVDVANPDLPRTTARLELARDVEDFTTVQGFGVMVVNAGDESAPTAELRVVSLHDPDNAPPLATLPLAAPTGKLFTLTGNYLAQVGSDPISGQSLLTIADLRDPLAPRVAGKLRLPELGYRRFSHRIFWQPSPSVDLVRSGDALVLYTFPGQSESKGGKLKVVSMKNRSNPRIRRTIDLGVTNVMDMKVGEDGKVYVTSYEPIPADPAAAPELGPGAPEVAGEPATASALLPGATLPAWRPSAGYARYYLRILDVSNPDQPRVSQAISVPGKFVGTTRLTDGGGTWTVVFTMDSLWQGEGDARAAVTAFDAMTLVSTNRKVRLLDVMGLPQGSDAVISRGASAFYTSARYWFGPVPLATGETPAPEAPRFELHRLDIARPDSIAEAAVADLGDGYGYLADVQNGFAFVTTGWSRLNVYDAREAGALRRIGSFPTMGWWNGRIVVAADGRAYLPTGLYGLKVIDLAQP